MKTELLKIGDTPAILLGEKSDRVYLFVHGKCGSKQEALPFAELACPRGWQVLGIDLPEHGGRQDGARLCPWDAAPELAAVMDYLKSGWQHISLRANSIGALFCMMSYQGAGVENCLFVSPIVDMKRLIEDMMGWAAVSRERLEAEGEIATEFGETLSWEYYTYVCRHPLDGWNAPTHILYAGRDNLTARGTIEAFSAAHRCALSVMEEGEHWFHTDAQLAVLREWEAANL